MAVHYSFNLEDLQNTNQTCIGKVKGPKRRCQRRIGKEKWARGTRDLSSLADLVVREPNVKNAIGALLCFQHKDQLSGIFDALFAEMSPVVCDKAPLRLLPPAVADRVDVQITDLTHRIDNLRLSEDSASEKQSLTPLTLKAERAADSHRRRSQGSSSIQRERLPLYPSGVISRAPSKELHATRQGPCTNKPRREIPRQLQHNAPVFTYNSIANMERGPTNQLSYSVQAPLKSNYDEDTSRIRDFFPRISEEFLVAIYGLSQDIRNDKYPTVQRKLFHLIHLAQIYPTKKALCQASSDLAVRQSFLINSWNKHENREYGEEE